MNNTIHIAFGFHVNCYHSYRGDTNDNLGFGSDIRIIRKIISTLNEFNEKGIPVKATWDSENFFSLEQILPQYAPDIIDGMKMRVKKYGDENIIMGYSNGALGAMNEAELEASVELAVTNQQGSGLKDIFGTYEKIVRPQEVMFTPSQVSVYNKLGVKALCLYYSCVPFDAFRTIVPKLSDEVAFNPLTYTYNGESMTVIPTYSNSDVCDAGCLRAWVKELHRKQESGEIQNDLFLFINMDADAIFWETMNLPVIKNRLANTDGIHGLVNEVADLPYIVFDTPGGYIKDHKPLGNIDFTHDTADGNFTGYASWAEKPYNRKIWTAVERSRAMSKVNSEIDSESPSFNDRVLLLSTTHFGLATPVLNIQREKKADALAKSIIESERSALKKVSELTICNISKSDLQCVQLKVNEKIESASQIVVEADGLADYAVIPMDGNPESVFLMMRFNEIKEEYSIKTKIGEIKQTEKSLELETDKMTVKFSVYGKPYKVLYNDKEIGGKDFLESYITYDGKRCDFDYKTVSPLECGGSGEGVRTTGEINLPGQLSAGSFTYDFFKFKTSDAIFVRITVKYPYTAETTSISTANSSLGRFSDMKWQEAVPLQFTPTFNGDVSVIKRNFMGNISSFRTQSFPECDKNNKALDSFNHQLTGGFTGLFDDEYGFTVGISRQVLNSMASCPMRLDEDKTVHMNPFGTYYGLQRHHWSRAKGEILSTYTLVTPQGKSIAPSYNGNSETAMLGLFCYKQQKKNDKVFADLTAFADGAVAIAPEGAILSAFYDDNVTFKEAQSDSVGENKLRNPILSGIGGNLGKYITRGTKAIGHIALSQLKSK